MRHARIAAIVVCSCLLCHAAGALGDEQQPQDKIAKLVEQLGAASFADREAASKELLDIGGPAAAALTKAAAGDDPEIRLRAKKILEVVLPLADLASPNRQKRIKAAQRIFNTELLSEKTERGRIPVFDSPALRKIVAALNANPDLLRSPSYLFTSEMRTRSLDESAKAAFEGSPLDLYLRDDFRSLAEKFPTSELAGKLIFDAGKFDEYLRQFPKGFYAPRARYCLIAGRKRYSTNREFEDIGPDDYVKVNREPMKIDPDKEIAAWPDFLKKYPDFEGADDANYRYARALEMKGRFVEACLQLRLRYPDGDMQPQTLERLLFIMDARMGARELSAMQAAFEHDPRPAPQLLFPADHVKLLVQHFAALKLSRAGDYAAAAAAFRVAASQAEDFFPPRVQPAPAVPGQANGAADEDVPAGIEHRMGKGWRRAIDFPTAVHQRAFDEADLCEKCAALATQPDGDRLYQLASVIYKHIGRWDVAGPWVLPGPWGKPHWMYWGVSSYYSTEDIPEFYEKDSKFWQAAQIYKKVMTDYPKCDSAAKALYMLANCHCHLAEPQCEPSMFWKKHRKENIEAAIKHYAGFAEKYPDHDLAPDATKAAKYLTQQLIDDAGANTTGP